MLTTFYNNIFSVAVFMIFHTFFITMTFATTIITIWHDISPFLLFIKNYSELSSSVFQFFSYHPLNLAPHLRFAHNQATICTRIVHFLLKIDKKSLKRTKLEQKSVKNVDFSCFLSSFFWILCLLSTFSCGIVFLWLKKETLWILYLVLLLYFQRF